MNYGYCRVSRKTQALERQIENVSKAYPDARIFAEKFTGTKMQGREELKKVLKLVKAEDTIIFDSVSRMSRNAEEGFALYQELYNKGINLVFLKEPHINTDVYKNTHQIATVGNDIADMYIETTNKVLMLLAEKQIQIAFDQAQKEVDDNHSRTSEGMRVKGAPEKISKARTGNKYETKKSKEMKVKIRKLSKSFDGTCTDAELLELLNISHNTLYKYKREMKGGDQ